MTSKNVTRFSDAIAAGVLYMRKKLYTFKMVIDHLTA